jgi:protein-S-isoprenylcysteine O-methyltransferase Ste14
MRKLLPPVLFALFALAMWGAERLPGADAVPSPYRHTGWLLGAAGMGLLASARLQFARARTNIYTFDEPGQLVTSGVFRWSRHPMYLGFTLVLLGWALLLGSAPALGLAGVFAVIADRWYIAFEERWMRSKFGPAYEAYAARTRRWF